MCLDIIATVWANLHYDPIYVPQFGQWVLDGYIGAYVDLLEGVCPFVVICFAFSLLSEALVSDSVMCSNHVLENALWCAGIVSWIG